MQQIIIHVKHWAAERLAYQSTTILNHFGLPMCDEQVRITYTYCTEVFTLLYNIFLHTISQNKEETTSANYEKQYRTTISAIIICKRQLLYSQSFFRPMDRCQ